MSTAARDPAVAAILRRPFTEQVAFFRGKLGNLVPTATWRDVWQSAHDRAFMVAGAARADLLADLAGAVDKAIAEGETLEAFRRRFGEIVRRHGWHGWTGEETAAGRAWRTRIIYQTNLSTSYSAGRLAQMRAAGFAYYVYRHSHAVAHPRPQHLAWHGLTLPAEHPFWRTHWPPNGWGCRCRVVGATGPQTARRLGGDPDKNLPPGWDSIDPKTGAPPGIDEGWGYQPGATVAEDVARVVERKLSQLPRPLAAEGRDALAVVARTSALRQANAEILRRVSGDIEHAALIGEDGTLQWIKRGERSAVQFSPDEIAQMRGGTLTHNHPRSMSFSVDDLRLVLRAGLARIYAIGNDGASIFAARVREGISDSALFDAHAAADRLAYQRLSPIITSMIARREITVDDANRYHSHAVNIVLARRGVIRYHAAIPGGTPQWLHDALRREVE